MPIPRATYRMQFHHEFTFADAEKLVPYLASLGISHLYASPITVARTGSTHGYDVVDSTRVSPVLGGDEGLEKLVKALRDHGMGLIIDIVPNHMGLGPENAWWQDVLAKGLQSPHAPVFDIGWDNRVVLPVLGDAFDVAVAGDHLKVEKRNGRFVLVAYDEHAFPIRDKDQDGDLTDLTALHARQHYRLASWRVANSELNWRRFFTINDLAGVRIEDDAVFEATHALIFRLYAAGLIDGVRIDHIDGLTDPTAYCRRLRARLGPDAWIVAEKILGPQESMTPDWGIDGTSGYDFMEAVAGVLHQEEGAEPLGALWAEVSGRSAEFAPEELAARQEMLATQFTGQLRQCVDAFTKLAASAGLGWNEGTIKQGLERLLWIFPVYRTYGTGADAPASDAAIRARVAERVKKFVENDDEGREVTDAVLAWLAGSQTGDPVLAADAVRRFQQLSSPIAAKSVEDTAFYRYGRLLSRNDVGFDAGRMAWDLGGFHLGAQERALHWPRALLATATHDHKRGEDVRARLAVISGIPALWRAAVMRWFALAAPYLDGVDKGDAYMLFQTLTGSLPADGKPTDEAALKTFAERVKGWQTKAVREARLRSNWEDPDAAYEAKLANLIEALLDPGRSAAFLADLTAFVHKLDPAARANTQAQVALRCLVPGLPDLYQGTELTDLSLVDPDNRRPVDYSLRLEACEIGGDSKDCEKIGLLTDLLALRKNHPQLFLEGTYEPVTVSGPRAGQVLAFVRRHGDTTLLCAVVVKASAAFVEQGQPLLTGEWWGDTRLTIGTEGSGAAKGQEFEAAKLFASKTIHAAVLET